MRARPDLDSTIERLLGGEVVDPRVAQLIFWVPVLLELVLQWAAHGTVPPPFVLGLLVLLVPTVGALVVADGVVSGRWLIWLPVLDIAAIGVFRLDPATAVGISVVYPAIWLGHQFGARGVGVTFLCVLGAFVVPTALLSGPSANLVSRVLQISLMAVMASGAVAVISDRWRRNAEESRVSQSQLALAMTAVLEQRRLTESIVSSVDVGLVALDARGHYHSVNPRQEQFLALAYPAGHEGWAGQEGFAYAADGVTVLEYDQMPTIRAMRGETLRDYLVWVGEDPAERRALAVSATPRHNRDGEFAGAVLAYHDITELMEAARIKEEFVASVSHELRTPLTSIMGYVEVILDDAAHLPPDVREHLTTVQRNARRLHRLVDDILFTALQSVSSVLDLERVDVRRLVEHSATEAGKSAEAAGLSLELEATCPEMSIHGDEERLAQVFDNLFSNAVKYTPAGGHVRGSVHRDGEEAVVRVQDTGRGIPPEELDEVFTKFFRSSDVQSEAIPGVGLGLAISKAIVEAHGGEIAVQSQVGVGTTFEVRLPLAGPRLVPAA